jgi:hypothetical protein
MDIITYAPDDPDGTSHTLAPADITRAIHRRFEGGVFVVLHPTKPNVYVYDPGNFWDGPTHLTWEPETGHFTFDGWTGEEHFPMIGPMR